MDFICKVVSLITVVGLAALLASCDGSKPFKDLNTYIEKLKMAEKEKSEDIVVTEQVPVTAKYASTTRRSPFEVMEVSPAKGRVSTNPLQAYPLDMLQFVGTVTQNGNSIAFISAPDNKIYQIKTGDIIGDHDGEVIKIESDRVSLMEQASENGSTGMKRVVTLQLKEASQ